MARNNLHITPDNVAEWMASTGFLFPRTLQELARFEKLYGDVEEDLKGCQVDPEEILRRRQGGNIISMEKKTETEKELKFRMAARKGDSSIPKHIMDKIKKNQDKRYGCSHRTPLFRSREK